MKKKVTKARIRSPSAMKTIRRRIESEPGRIWRADDFLDLPPMATAKAISRLTQEGELQRLSKGTYYRAAESSFGKTRPNPIAIRKLAQKKRAIFPAGNAAANLLGFTTQIARRSEIATPARSVPRKLVGEEAVVHTRRPEAWSGLTEQEGALLDFIRRGGRTSELDPKEALRHLRKLLETSIGLPRMLDVAATEPPRVRAILGAIAEDMGTSRAKLESLRKSLNPYSRFDFGIFSAIPCARNWQAKDARRRETVRA